MGEGGGRKIGGFRDAAGRKFQIRGRSAGEDTAAPTDRPIGATA
jgi:hypothetical protein